LEATVRDRKYIDEEIQSRLNFGNFCYHFRHSLSSHPLSKSIKIKIYKIIILSVVLYVCETWSLTLREERRVRVFENRVLKRTFGPKREAGEDCIMRSFITFTLHQTLFR
jgi:hypothetical protein